MLSRIAIPTVALLALACPAWAMPMSGTFNIHYDKQAPQPIAPDHVKIDESGSGLNKSPGQPLDNAQVTVTDTVTLVRGTGPVKGTITFTTPNGALTSAYTGKVTTGAQGLMSSQGKFRTVSGTGALAGTKGSGTFTAAFSSQTDFTSNWTGNFKLPGNKISRR